MDFGFTEEQELIRTEVRNLARKFDWEYWRIKDKTGEYPHEFFDEFAKAGWLGIAMPREYGGAVWELLRRVFSCWRSPPLEPARRVVRPFTSASSHRCPSSNMAQRNRSAAIYPN